MKPLVLSEAEVPRRELKSDTPNAAPIFCKIEKRICALLNSGAGFAASMT